MKGNMKKLVVFVVVVTIATFISATMALACDKYMHCGKHRKAIHGEYAATSVVSCNTYVPDGTVNTGVATQLTTYTFNCDGTGTTEGRFVSIGFSKTPGELFVDMWWEFTYEVADDGTITIDVVPGKGLWKVPNTDFVVFTYTGGTSSDSGRLSADHKTIILGTPEPNVTELTFYDGRVFITKCNTSRVLIRVDK